MARFGSDKSVSSDMILAVVGEFRVGWDCTVVLGPDGNDPPGWENIVPTPCGSWGVGQPFCDGAPPKLWGTVNPLPNETEAVPGGVWGGAGTVNTFKNNNYIDPVLNEEQLKIYLADQCQTKDYKNSVLHFDFIYPFFL